MADIILAEKIMVGNNSNNWFKPEPLPIHKKCILPEVWKEMIC
jgi:hypothetical protein